MGWRWHQLDYMQIICTLLQTDNHASTSSLTFYWLDALPDAQLTASKHWRHREHRKMTQYSSWDEIHCFTKFPIMKQSTTRMWANAQRDSHPAEYRWRPLFNDAKFGWRPLLECLAVTLPRRETGWNLQGCPKLMKWSQPLVGKVHHIMGTCGGHIAA